MNKKLILLFGLIIPLLSSCIKDEPLNREADIVDITVEGGVFIDRSISEDNNTIELILSVDAELTKITPILTLTPQATVSPASGTPIDLSYGKEVIYTVTSQSGDFQKRYTVKVGEIKMKFGFEEWEISKGGGNHPYPILSDTKWSNANAGVSLAVAIGALKDFKRYPTKDTTLCVNGKYAATLETLKGARVIFYDIPIFAGNLFLGDFETNAGAPLKSLKLGRSHPKSTGKPTHFKGFYKYTPGPVVIGPDYKEIPGRTDEMSLYAVLFRVSKGAAPDKEFLDGTTIQNSEQIVGRAEWAIDAEGMIEKEAINGFTEFSIPFKYTQAIDYDKYDYRLTIVCSSSKDGNLYIGAVGSSLIVDDLEIVCEPID